MIYLNNLPTICENIVNLSFVSYKKNKKICKFIKYIPKIVSIYEITENQDKYDCNNIFLDDNYVKKYFSLIYIDYNNIEKITLKQLKKFIITLNKNYDLCFINDNQESNLLKLYNNEI